MYWIAAILTEQGKRSEALEFAEKALALNEERNADSELEGPFEDFADIENRLQRLHQYLQGEATHYW